MGCGPRSWGGPGTSRRRTVAAKAHGVEPQTLGAWRGFRFGRRGRWTLDEGNNAGQEERIVATAPQWEQAEVRRGLTTKRCVVWLSCAIITTWRRRTAQAPPGQGTFVPAARQVAARCRCCARPPATCVAPAGCCCGRQMTRSRPTHQRVPIASVAALERSATWRVRAAWGPQGRSAVRTTATAEPLVELPKQRASR